MTAAPTFDGDAVMAAADLVRRTGATGMQIGYLNDEPPHEWYAYAQYRGSRISVDGHPGPVEAADALSRRLLTGARCQCGALVALSDIGALAYETTVMTDGSTWDLKTASEAGQCRWTRRGAHWVRGCA